MAKIFISYKRVDKDKVFRIKDKIEAALGEKCWIDLDGIESDAQFKHVIIKAINDSKIFLFMYSKAHIGADNYWTTRELNFANRRSKRIIFLNIDNAPLTDEYEFDFGTQQQIDGTSIYAMDKLINDLKKWLFIYEDTPQLKSKNFQWKKCITNYIYTIKRQKKRLITFLLIVMAVIAIVGSILSHLSFEGLSAKEEVYNIENYNTFTYFKIESVLMTPSYFSEDAHAKQITYLRKAAELGDADAQNQLGFCYYIGDGIEQNYEEAVKWFQKAAEQGNAKAQNHLGICYAEGHGVERHLAESIKWFQKAAVKGETRARYNLGFYYDGGFGMEVDHYMAAFWYRMAAEQGEAKAQYNLGVCYGRGDGVPQNYEEAVKWFQKSAEQGEVHAQYAIGGCYEKGFGVEIDYDEATYWYQKAAEQGFVAAQKALEAFEFYP